MHTPQIRQLSVDQKHFTNSESNAHFQDTTVNPKGLSSETRKDRNTEEEDFFNSLIPEIPIYEPPKEALEMAGDTDEEEDEVYNMILVDALTPAQLEAIAVKKEESKRRSQKYENCVFIPVLFCCSSYEVMPGAIVQGGEGPIRIPIPKDDTAQNSLWALRRAAQEFYQAWEYDSDEELADMELDYFDGSEWHPLFDDDSAALKRVFAAINTKQFVNPTANVDETLSIQNQESSNGRSSTGTAPPPSTGQAHRHTARKTKRQKPVPIRWLPFFDDPSSLMVPYAHCV